MFIPKERSPAELLGFEADGCCLGYQASKFECLSSNKAAIPLVHVIAQLKNLSTNQIFTVCSYLYFISFSLIAVDEPHL